MNFNANERLRHITLAEQAARSGRFGEAAHHTAQAGVCSLMLAERSDRAIARAHVDDAVEMASHAESLIRRAGTTAPREQSQKLPDSANEGEKESDGTEWSLSARPQVRLSDVIGLDEVKQALFDNVIGPRLHSEDYKDWNKDIEAGVLLYGPPGNGKSYIAAAIAGELDARFFSVDAATIKSKWVGAAEKNIKRLFAEAARYERSIIFIDECDSILAARSDEKVNIPNQLQTEIDGVAKKGRAGGQFVIAATNRPWLVGTALLRPGRLGRHIYVGLPDAPAREAILRDCLAKVRVEPDIPFGAFADQLEGCSGADIHWGCERAKDRGLKRQIASGIKERLMLHDLEAAFKDAPRSVTPKELTRFEEWKRARGQSN